MNLFGLAIATIPLVFSTIAWLGGDLAVAVIFLGFNFLLNLPHQYGTWRRIVTERRLDGTWVGVALLVSGAMATVTLAPPWLRSLILGDLFIYWGLYHLAVQNLGIGRILAGRDGIALTPLSQDRWFHLGIFGLVALWAHATTPMCYDLLGEEVVLQRLPVSPLVAMAMASMVIVCALGLIGWRSRRWIHQRQAAATSFEIGTLLAIIAALVAPSLPVTIAGLTAVHNVQYLLLVERQQNRRGHPSSWRDVVIVLAYVLGVAGVFLWDDTWGVVLFATLVSWHYLADARLWRPSRDPLLARDLGLGVRAP
jgi:hypothetical protein